MRNYAIIIPVLNPTEKLIDYVKELLDNGAYKIIIVNDGSDKDSETIFSMLSSLERCTVLTHEHTKGKGSALKTAFQYFLKYHRDLVGVITVDADGRYSIEDVCKVAKELQTSNKGIVLGVRDFSKKSVSFLSRVGNKTTSFLFRLLYGSRLRDVQTGLRGIHTNEILKVVALKGERSDYETNMLIHAKKSNAKISEIPIQTNYINHNIDSPYPSIVDSLKVISILFTGLLKYSFITIASGLIDIVSFIVLVSLIFGEYPLHLRLFLSTVIARILSSTFNFYMNRNVVFHSENRLRESIIKYYLLFLGLIFSSYLIVMFMNLILGIHVVLAKIIVDSILGMISFNLQLNWVFNNKTKSVGK